ALEAGLAGFPLGGDVLGDVSGVIAAKAEQCRSAGVLPLQSEEVEPRLIGDSPAVPQVASFVCDGQLDPGVVRLKAGRPDDRVGFDAGAVGESNDASGTLQCSWLESDATALRLRRARSNQRLAFAEPSAKARVDRDSLHAKHGEPPEDLPPQQSPRQRRLP